MRCHEGPMLPNGVLEDSHMNLVPDVEGKMLEAVEKRSEPRGLARTYASERANPLTSEDLVNANGKDITSMSRIFGSGCHRNRNCMTRWEVASFQVCPKSFPIEGGHSSIRDVEDGLRHASVPQFRLSVGLNALTPLVRNRAHTTLPEAAFPQEVDEGEFNSTKWAFAFLTMKRSLM